MNDRIKAAALGALAVIATALLVLTISDDDPVPVVLERSSTVAPPAPPTEDAEGSIGPAERDRVAAAAERVAGEGRAVEVERSDDPGEAFEVEVWTSRGEVDVALDAKLQRVPNAAYED